MVVVAVVLAVALFFGLPFLQYTVGGPGGPALLTATVRVPLSCPLAGVGLVYASWAGWTGYEWSWGCRAPSDVAVPNPGHWNATAH